MVSLRNVMYFDYSGLVRCYVSFFLSLTSSTYSLYVYRFIVDLITLYYTHTLGRTALEEDSARRRDRYLTTHNTHNRHTSTPPAGFETSIQASERPQTHALDRAATEIGVCYSV